MLCVSGKVASWSSSAHIPIHITVRACWERNLNMSSDDVVRSVITEVGYNGDDILARANGAEAKAELRARTREAKESGLCGVPTYRVLRRRVGEGEDAWKRFGDIVWGQDEIPVVEDLIAGWNGKGIAEVETGRHNRSSRL